MHAIRIHRVVVFFQLYVYKLFTCICIVYFFVSLYMICTCDFSVYDVKVVQIMLETVLKKNILLFRTQEAKILQ